MTASESEESLLGCYSLHIAVPSLLSAFAYPPFFPAELSGPDLKSSPVQQ